MESNGLPQMLRNMIDTLLCDNTLESWQIRGGEMHTIVTLKVKMTTGTFSSVENDHFKRKSMSQIERDRVRAGQWRDTTNINSYMIKNLTN